MSTYRRHPKPEKMVPATGNPAEVPASRIRHLRARRLRIAPEPRDPEAVRAGILALIAAVREVSGDAGE